jgi:hypothetical protein
VSAQKSCGEIPFAIRNAAGLGAHFITPGIVSWSSSLSIEGSRTGGALLLLDRMSRRNIKPTTFHDDSRSSDAGSVVAAPRSKSRAKDPAKDAAPIRERVSQAEANALSALIGSKAVPFIGPDGEIQVSPLLFAM